jgi:hypothetical protein
VPRRIAMGSPRGIATVGILPRERDLMDGCCKMAISNNVGGVKHSVRTRPRALVGERFRKWPVEQHRSSPRHQVYLRQRGM